MSSASTAGCGVFEALEDGGACSSDTITKSSLDLSPDLCEVPSGGEDTVLLCVQPHGMHIPSFSLNMRCSEIKIEAANDPYPEPQPILHQRTLPMSLVLHGNLFLMIFTMIVILM